MTSPRFLAEPLWKYGARVATARSTGPLNLPTSPQSPVISDRPGSVVVLISWVTLLRSVYSGMSDVRREASAIPMLSCRLTEWLPLLGVLWHEVQVPTRFAGRPNAGLSLMPATPEMLMRLVLNSAWPRATARRSSSRRSWRRLVHES